MQYDRQLTLSAAGNRRATSWPPQTLYWSEFVERLRHPARGTETLAEYLRLPKAKQDERKDVGGYVGGTLRGNRRKAANLLGRDFLSLDLDNIPAGGTDDVLRRLEGLGCAFAAHSTRKHEPGRPRLRALFPFNRTAQTDEYEPCGRKVGQLIGIDLFDPSSFEPSRLMYWPSCSADSQYIFHYADKPFLDVDGLLRLYRDWHDVREWPEVPGVGQAHVKLAARQGDPRAKHGVVGAFCQVYDIYRALDTFLPGVYVPTEDDSGRLTYTGGSTTGGAVVYDNGDFLFSHHATDPCGGRLVNSFDLVRLHRFGDMDDESKPDTPVNKLPSYTAMCELAVADTSVAALINQERYEQATQDFTHVPPAEDEPANWMPLLQVNPSSGAPAKTIRNVQIMLEHDPLLKARIRKDTFAEAIFGVAPLPWGAREREVGAFRWTDDDDRGLRKYMERVLGWQSRDLVDVAVGDHAAKYGFNPVTAYLQSLSWDGTPRLDTLLIDYLGAPDTPYVRAVTRKAFTAAVARAMVPGTKFDNMTILTGAQGLGKSTLLKKMGRAWFSDSIKTFEGKEASELVRGVWIVEISELEAFNRSETGRIKQFLSQQEDIFRAAYGRHVGWYPRRCVFFGTSNNGEYLRDRTGNRRFWPVDVGVQDASKRVFGGLDEEVDQVWAEAYVRWQLAEPLYLTGDLEKAATAEQEAHQEADPREGVIREFVERMVPEGWDKQSLSDRMLYWSGEFGRGNVDPSTLVPRDRICAAEVWCECLRSDIRWMKRTDTMSINGVLDEIDGWAKHKNPFRFGPYGMVKGGYLRM